MTDYDDYDDDDLDEIEAEKEYDDNPKLPSKKSVAKIMKAVNDDGSLKTIIRARRSDFVHNLIHLDGQKFDFTGRHYLKPIYDRDDAQILLKTARQVEKCLAISTSYVMSGCDLKRIDQLRPGDILNTIVPGVPYYILDEVVASEPNGLKRCLKITVEGGFFVEATLNHPLFEKTKGWVNVESLIEGDEILCKAVYQKITKIEDVGIQETWALQTQTGVFVANGIVNHNTTFLANNLTVTSVVRPYNKALYVSPSHMQTRQFSNEKLRPAIEKSPYIKRYFQDSSISTQVFEKGFTNGSFIFLRSAFRSADRARGISVRILCYDELQDFIMSTIPVIMECTSHFIDARILMAGTPKSLDNPIETYWGHTTQNEWLVKCRHCNDMNFLDERNIAPTEMYVSKKLPPGPVCKHCMKPIYPHLDGRWVSFKSGAPIQGYRVPQLMVPWICGLYDQWLKLLLKRDSYPMSQFYNEVLGLSYDSASKPVTREQLIACCRDYDMWRSSDLTYAVQEARNVPNLTAGIDWGEGLSSDEKSPSGKIRTASYTILTVGGYVDQKHWKTCLVKKYEGKETDPGYIVRDVARICNALNVGLAGVDWGHGWGVNNELVRILTPKRVVQFQHLGKLKQKMKWDPIGFRYHLHRNFLMSELFFDLKHQFVWFPRWAQIEPFAKDILAIYAEYSEMRREMKYDHRHSEPDDFFHSLLYAKLASDICEGRTRRYTANID